jgi:putative membrane protein insertion efficiency factor
VTDRFIMIARHVTVLGLSLPIRLYRGLISPMLPASCRFDPTCSAYALEALHAHGPVKGLYLAVRRILRCHPITWLGGSSGFDPVPPAHTRP